MAPPKNFHRFVSLPPELRYEIWAYVRDDPLPHTHHFGATRQTDDGALMCIECTGHNGECWGCLGPLALACWESYGVVRSRLGEMRNTKNHDNGEEEQDEEEDEEEEAQEEAVKEKEECFRLGKQSVLVSCLLKGWRCKFCRANLGLRDVSERVIVQAQAQKGVLGRLSLGGLGGFQL